MFKQRWRQTHIDTFLRAVKTGYIRSILDLIVISIKHAGPTSTLPFGES